MDEPPPDADLVRERRGSSGRRLRLVLAALAVAALVALAVMLVGGGGHAIPSHLGAGPAPAGSSWTGGAG